MNKVRRGNPFTPLNDLRAIGELAGDFINDENSLRSSWNKLSSLQNPKQITCPFRRSPNNNCVKVLGSSEAVPLCTVRLTGGGYLAVCSERVANEQVITEIIKELGLENATIEKDVKLSRSGRAYDFLVKAYDRNNNLYMVFLEVITVDTTNTGSLSNALKKFKQSININWENVRHRLSINWENVRKREVLQMLYKDRILKEVAREIARTFANVNICYIGLIQNITFEKLFKNNNISLPFRDFCSNYVNYNNYNWSLGFLTFSMIKENNRLLIKLAEEVPHVIVVELNNLIEPRSEVIREDVEKLKERLEDFIQARSSK